MISADLTIKIRYEWIGDHHLLMHFYGCKINHWSLIDLSDISSKTGLSYEQILQRLATGRKEVT